VSGSRLYCIDDYATLPDVDQQAVREMDEELDRKPTSSRVAETLRERKLALNGRTFFSRTARRRLFARRRTKRARCPRHGHLPDRRPGSSD